MKREDICKPRKAVEIGQTLRDKNGSKFTVNEVCPYLCCRQNNSGNQSCVKSEKGIFEEDSEWYGSWQLNKNRKSFEICAFKMKPKPENFDFIEHMKNVYSLHCAYGVLNEEDLCFSLWELTKEPRLKTSEQLGIKVETGEAFTDIDGNEIVVISSCPYWPDSSVCMALSPCILTDKGFYYDARPSVYCDGGRWRIREKITWKKNKIATFEDCEDLIRWRRRKRKNDKRRERQRKWRENHGN
jgi:hypothetical protein